MKAIQKLKLAMNGNKNKNRVANLTKAEREAKAAFAVLHPVTAGVIPMVDYVPPQGSYHPASRSTVPTSAQCQFARNVFNILE